jgi:hypothetical protein
MLRRTKAMRLWRVDGASPPGNSIADPEASWHGMCMSEIEAPVAMA